MVKWKELILAIVICQLAGIIGSLFTFSAISTWYATLVKPSFSPPNWVFGPVWTLLYTLMGISVYLIYISKSKEKFDAMKIFGFQLFLNAIWSIVFFGMKSPLYALAIIALLWLSIIFTTIKFYKINKTASFLLIPYLLWVSFASILNYYIWVLN